MYAASTAGTLITAHFFLLGYRIATHLKVSLTLKQWQRKCRTTMHAGQQCRPPKVRQKVPAVGPECLASKQVGDLPTQIQISHHASRLCTV